MGMHAARLQNLCGTALRSQRCTYLKQWSVSGPTHASLFVLPACNASVHTFGNGHDSIKDKLHESVLQCIAYVLHISFCTILH